VEANRPDVDRDKDRKEMMITFKKCLNDLLEILPHILAESSELQFTWTIEIRTILEDIDDLIDTVLLSSEYRELLISVIESELNDSPGPRKC
jgi:hypothetical protein